MKLYDEQQVRKTIALLKPDGQLFEARAIYGDRQVYSGYFTDADTLLNAISRMPEKDCNVYITLNTLNNACYSRTQKDKFEKNVKNSTSDNDVQGYDWLMIDLDPKRPSGTSSSDEEIQYAKDTGNKIYNALKILGFEKPVFAYSGNGVHLLYKIHLANTDEMRQLVKKCLDVLHLMFSDEKVDVDPKNFNPARITKCYGFLSQKGSNTEERPHRLSFILGGYDYYRNIKATDVEYLRKLADLVPDEPEKPQSYNNYNPRTFDIESWFDKHNIGYRTVGYNDGGTKYILDHCPFNENHNGKDAVVIKRSNGALSYICLHASCQDKHWREFRMHYEPNAYEKREQYQERMMYGQFNRDKKPEPKKIQKKEGEPIFFTAQMILDRKYPEESFIRTGIDVIDRKMRGLKKGHVSVWSGLRASAKSTVLSQICLNAVDTGNNVAVYSGELTESNFMKWMNLQAAGKSRVREGRYEGFYETPIEIQEKIAKWLGTHFWLYNNAYGNNYRAVIAEFEKKADENKLDLLILDNLMAFNISDMGYTKWDAQTAFVQSLCSIAKSRSLHIAFVAHPKKANGFLRFDDISGTADLGNAVDEAYIVHRNNNDFRRLSKEMFKWSDDNEVYEGTNVIEIVKDRDGGNQDVFIPLYYEVESKRLKNGKAENKIYGWDRNDSPLPTLADFENAEDGSEPIPFD